jgi:hypothetical protein
VSPARFSEDFVRKPEAQLFVVVVLRRIEEESNGAVMYERLGILRYTESFDEERPVARWFNAENVVQGTAFNIV